MEIIKKKTDSELNAALAGRLDTTTAPHDKQLFRKESIDRVSSPEQLNDYVRISNPGVWMLLAAVIVLLTGVCVWGIFGALTTTVNAAAVCSNNTLTLYIKEPDIDSVKAGMDVNVNGISCKLSEISGTPVPVDGLDEYLVHKGGFQAGEWVYTATADADIPDGVYPADIVVESVSPMFFVVN